MESNHKHGEHPRFEKHRWDLQRRGEHPLSNYCRHLDMTCLRWQRTILHSILSDKGPDKSIVRKTWRHDHMHIRNNQGAIEPTLAPRTSLQWVSGRNGQHGAATQEHHLGVAKSANRRGLGQRKQKQQQQTRIGLVTVRLVGNMGGPRRRPGAKVARDP